MRKTICLIFVVLMITNLSGMALPVEAAETVFDGTYTQVQGFNWGADANLITFNSSAKTFVLDANQGGDYYKFQGTYIVKSNQAFCTVIGQGSYSGALFVMTDMNGNLYFEWDDKLITIMQDGALFKSVKNTAVVPVMPWETAYMAKIKAWNNEHGACRLALYDINEDNTPELFLYSWENHFVYTYLNGEVIQIGEIDTRLQLYQSEDKNSILACGGFGTGAEGGMRYVMENGQLTAGGIKFSYEFPYEQAGHYYIGDQEVSESEYNALERKVTDPANRIYEVYSGINETIHEETRLPDYITRRNWQAPVIKVVVDDKPMTFDQPPVLDNGRTLVPVRAIFEALGATVTWDDVTNTAIAKKGETVIKIQLENSVMHKDDQDYSLDVPAKIINDRTLVPVRAVSEAMSARVNWDEATQTVNITSHEDYVKYFAHSLWTIIENQGGIGQFVTERGTADGDCIKAMIACRGQASKNDVILDTTSFAVNATLTFYKLSHGDISGVKELVKVTKKTVMKKATDLIEDIASDKVVEAVSAVSADDFIWNIANNSYNNNSELFIKFAGIHASAQGKMDYETSVQYITMYQAIRMNSNSIKMGTNFFKNKLPDGGLESLGTVLGNLLVDYATDKVELIDQDGVLDKVIKKEVLDKWTDLIELNNTDISDWAKENKRLQEELMDVLS